MKVLLPTICTLFLLACGKVEVPPSQQVTVLETPTEKLIVYLLLILIGSMIILCILANGYFNKFSSYEKSIDYSVASLADIKNKLQTDLINLSEMTKQLSTQINQQQGIIDGERRKNAVLEQSIAQKTFEFESYMKNIEKESKIAKEALVNDFEMKIREKDIVSNKTKADLEKAIGQVSQLEIQRDILHNFLMKYGINIYETEKNIGAQKKIWIEKLAIGDINSVLSEIRNEPFFDQKSYEDFKLKVILLSSKYADLEKQIRESKISARSDEAKTTKSGIVNSIHELIVELNKSSEK